ncbi:hypothetical protein [Azospirillum halopraeferens]|uniref:hypothetical protein n=1 Tax=Azospirillum halopraeferens TaxID=34010 RepID=UPI000429F341|nr:hypothetical protein [Azospirillum halopraeferens]
MSIRIHVAALALFLLSACAANHTATRPDAAPYQPGVQSPSLDVPVFDAIGLF